MVEGDNLIVIQLIWEEIDISWIIFNMIKDTEKFLNRCIIVSIIYIFREGNRAVDWVVVAGYVVYNAVEWIILLFLELDSIL